MNKNEQQAGTSIEAKGCNVKLNLSEGDKAFQAFGISDERADQVTEFLNKAVKESESVTDLVGKIVEFSKNDNEFAFIVYSAGRRMGIKEERIRALGPLAALLD